MKLNYKRLGKGEPLLIMHGLLGMLDNWQGPAKLLSEDFDVIILDLRNHGHSPHSDEHNYALMAADVIELMDDLKIDTAYLLGHSMGGKVAMWLAEKYPARVRKLVVADIGPKYYPSHHQIIFAALRAVPLDKLDKRGDADEYMEAYIDEAVVRQFLAKSLYHPSRNGFAWRFNLDALETNIENVGIAVDELGYEGPTLFIRGSRSGYISDEDWPDIKVLYPEAYLYTVDGAGHWLHAEKPAEFVKAVRDFLLS